MRLVAARREYVGKRPRTVYSITEAGRQVLREWLDTPVSPFAMDFEAMIRLFIAPLGTKEQLLATLDDWAERTLAEIQGWKDLSPDGKNDRGLQIMAQLPAPTPRERTERTPLPPRTQQRRRWSSGSSSTE